MVISATLGWGNTSPVFTALLGIALLGERLRVVGWIVIIVALAGASLIAVGKDEYFHIDMAAIVVLLAAVTWSLYFVGQ